MNEGTEFNKIIKSQFKCGTSQILRYKNNMHQNKCEI